MPYLSPPTLTRSEQQSLLEVSASHPRDHLIFSLALGTGLRLAEIVGLNVGDVFTADGKPRSRIRLRKEIAKGGRAGDVFLPDALGPKLVRFWRYKVRSGESVDAARAALLQPVRPPHLQTPRPDGIQDLAGARGVRPDLRVSCA